MDRDPLVARLHIYKTTSFNRMESEKIISEHLRKDGALDEYIPEQTHVQCTQAITICLFWYVLFSSGLLKDKSKGFPDI